MPAWFDFMICFCVPGLVVFGTGGNRTIYFYFLKKGGIVFEIGLMARLKHMMQYWSTKRVAKVRSSWLRNMSFSNGGWEFITVVLVCWWCGWERKRVGGGGGEMLVESSEMVSPSNWLRWFQSFFKFCSLWSFENWIVLSFCRFGLSEMLMRVRSYGSWQDEADCFCPGDCFVGFGWPDSARRKRRRKGWERWLCFFFFKKYNDNNVNNLFF